MTNDQLRSLRRLAKRYRITFRSVPDDWPAAHLTTFQNIKKLGDRKFDSYSESISIRSHEEPWTEQTKHRAKWLAERASQLFGQERNEAGWRLVLENEVLRRFSVEVACPKCRARVWRSEIEAGLDESSDLAQRLEQRQKDRARCQCLPESRPQDYYELGTNRLFDDRAQELIIHDLMLRSELPKQQPDRIYGLKATRNFEELLSQSIPCTASDADSITLRDLIRSSPFKTESDPLLFPFLVLEAKSESSPCGFDDIQAQTAFPIWSLLKLQEDLLSHNVGLESSFEPLVWFLAYRGDAWRVYGCSITKEIHNEKPSYDIFLLWQGSLISKDSAIQLVLIVDYILDWARDVYRPSILRHLKSISTGKSYDQISLANDSDIFSMRRNISNWIPAAPSTVDILNDPMDSNEILDHSDILKLSVPNTQLGSVRSAEINTYRYVQLHITESNVTSLLQLAGGSNQHLGMTVKAARELVNFISRWNEMLLITDVVLNELEYIWTEEMRSDTSAESLSLTEEFYTLLEFSCFMSSSWEITKELTCLAISKPAFETLRTYAGFKSRHRGAESLPDIVRPCGMNVLRECIDCVKSGSPWQVLLCAMTSVVVSLYPLPERKRADFVPPVDSLRFGYPRSPRVKPFAQKFLGLRKMTPLGKRRDYLGNEHEEWVRTLLKRARLSKRNRGAVDMSFKRISERQVRNCNAFHDPKDCDRCRKGSQDELYTKTLTMNRPSEVSTYKAVLIESPESHSSTATRHDICLFVLEVSELLERKEALPIIIEDILQTDMLYHTIIRHPGLKDVDNCRVYSWNLPLPYRPPTEDQRNDINNWCRELLHQPITKRDQKGIEPNIWTQLQMLLYFLHSGYSYLSANKAIMDFCESFSAIVRKRNEAIKYPGPSWTMTDPNHCLTLNDFFNTIDEEENKDDSKLEKPWVPLYPPPKLSLKGD